MSRVKPTRSSFGVMVVLCAFGLAVAVSTAQQEGRGTAETGRGEGGRGGRGRGFPPPNGVAPVPLPNGPMVDGFLYVLTEEDEAALLKIEPTP
jgi:hypothetical protein